jgi:hypothetical protein
MAGIAAEPLTRREAPGFDVETLALSWRNAMRKHPEFFNDAGFYQGEFRQACAAAGALLLEDAARNHGLKAALALAITAEWRAKDICLALNYTNLALAIPGLSGECRDALLTRRARLLKKQEDRK